MPPAGFVLSESNGFTGTITGKYYDDYVKKFNGLLDQLIAEPNPYDAKFTSIAAR